MNVVLMGAPGVGKGTQARYLVENRGLVHISTGDMLRAAVAGGSELGRRAGAVMAAGELVPDDLMMKLVRERLQQADVAGGWLLDGFPRTAPQAEGLAALLDDIGQTVDAVLVITAPDEEIIRRLTSRVSCRVCGKIMNRKELDPARPDVCPACGAQTDPRTGKPAIYQREDDREETIRHRLEVFSTQTLAAAEALAARYPSYQIEGTGTPDEVAARVADVLG